MRVPGATGTNALCAEGSNGVLCASCEAGHYMSSKFTCRTCADVEFELHPALALALALLFMVAAFRIQALASC